ncbi:MAG TPA: SCO family protein [Flavobacteriaceae bacterium]|nr:SCO family protein [Flavobacteriaceae bacterium]
MKGKRGYIIGLSVIILLFGLWAVKEFNHRYKYDELLQPDKITGRKTAPKQKKIKKTEELEYIVLDGEKAKAPEFQLVNQHNDTISQLDYEGKVYVVEFFYTSCPTICPIMNQNLIEVAEEFKNNDNFGIASFSIDPKRDTPETLKEYADKHKIIHPHWNLLTGEREKIYNLALEGFKLIAQDDAQEPGGIMHDGLFVLIDQDGYIRSRKDDFGNPLIYYRGYIERDAVAELGQEEPQINELIEDIRTLVRN